MRRRRVAANGAPAPLVGKDSKGLVVWLVFSLWFMYWIAPQWWLASKGLSPVLKLPLIMYVVLIPALALKVATNPSWLRRWQWYAPFLAFLLLGVLHIPFAPNSILAYEQMTQMALFWLIIVATISVGDTVRRVEQLLFLFDISFLWWAALGAQTGRVPWHTVWGNPDGFGALMVGGIGMCWFLYLGSEKGWFRRAMLVSTGLCAIGVVASFARGAFLGAAGILGVIWLRSPHKGRTLAGGIVLVILMIGAAEVLYPGMFWAEIESTFAEGTTEGTGEDRWILWGAAFRVFLENPIFGAGPDNFGPFAARYFQVGELGGVYGINPGRLFNRSLHSLWMQFLSERGAVGMGLWIWMLVDFWRRNAEMRTAAAGEAWKAMGGRLELKSVALGLEASMVAFMVTSAFYALFGPPWLWSLLALNLAAHAVAVRQSPLKAGNRPRMPAPRRRPARARPGPGVIAPAARVAAARSGAPRR